MQQLLFLTSIQTHHLIVWGGTIAETLVTPEDGFQPF